MNEFETKDGREDMPIFIHSALDDYGLSAIEFRVYARLARRCGRSGAYESVPSMAKDFEVSTRTVQRSLKVLVRCNLLSESVRLGKPTCYTINSQSAWLPSTQLKQIRNEVFAKPGSDTTTPSSHVTPDTTDGGGVTPQTDEGTPLKVLQNTPTETPAGVSVEVMFNSSGKPTGEWWRYGVRVLSVDNQSDKGLRALLGRESGRHGPKRVLEALRQTEAAKPAEPKSYFLGILKKSKTADDVCMDFVARMRAKAEGMTYGTGDPRRTARDAEGADSSIVSSSNASAA